MTTRKMIEAPYWRYAPEWCDFDDIQFCSQWMYEEPILHNCRGCPHLKKEYYKKAIGRFGGGQT